MASAAAAIGYNQSARTQFDASEITHYDNQYIRQFVGIDLSQNRFACRARRLTVVVGTEVLPLMPQHIGVAHVAGVVVFLLVSFQMRLHLLYCTHRQGDGNELAALFSVNALGRGNDGFIRIFAHAAKIMQTEERTFMLA